MTHSYRPDSRRGTAAVIVGLAMALLVSITPPARAGIPAVDYSGPAFYLEHRGPGADPEGWIGGAPGYSAGGRVLYTPGVSEGIRYIQVSLDGRPVASQLIGANDVQGAWLNGNLPTNDVADGAHTVRIEVTDTNGHVGAVSLPVLVDNTAPEQPGNVTVEGGTGWRAQPSRRVGWTLPKQQFSRIAAARTRLCPAEAESSDPKTSAAAKQDCVEDTYSGAALTSPTQSVEIPRPGLWTLRVWLVDAAGNSNPDAATVVTGLGYDPTPPQVTGFAAQDPSDPARVFVGASEDVSSLASGSIEVQRHGSGLWRPLATEVRAGGITAFLDDATLRKGRYRLRANVTNAAGLQHGTDQGADGQVKTLTLPIRVASRLQTGRRTGKVCHGRGKKRRCQWRLQRKLAVELGRRILLRGRLTVGGRPIPQQPLEVWQRVSVAGADWQPVDSVQTDARGRFRYKTAKGPARALRFRYPGTPHIRSDNGTVRLRVQAASTLEASRRNVINGEYVTFHGKLKGGHRPPGGVLVELQVLSRGRWRTFAQPRADAATGAWNYQYRFETVRAGARFRFRARVRRQAGYPYATGSSRILKISVRGL